MRILGFPLATLIYDFVVPFVIIGGMFYYCWYIEKVEAGQKKKEKR